MTTYLLTHREVTLPFCSTLCRGIYEEKTPFLYPTREFKAPVWRDDDRYEFDETCMNCGALVRSMES